MTVWNLFEHTSHRKIRKLQDLTIQHLKKSHAEPCARKVPKRFDNVRLPGTYRSRDLHDSICHTLIDPDDLSFADEKLCVSFV